MKFQLIIFVTVIIFGAVSCGTDDTRLDDDQITTIPSVSTLEPSEIMTRSFRSGGIILDDGGGEIIERGIYWDINPTSFDAKEEFLDGMVNSFELLVNGLSSGFRGQTVYSKAYARNDLGISFGEVVTFNLKVSDGPVVPPCNLTANTVSVFNNQLETFSNITSELSNISQEYEFNAINFDTRVEVSFKEKPQTGIYTTRGYGGFFEEYYTCTMRILDGSTSIYFYPETEQSAVYVEQIDENNFSISFCELQFNGNFNSTNLDFISNGSFTTNN